MLLGVSRWGKNSAANGKKKKIIFCHFLPLFATLSFAIKDEIGSGRKRMWFNDCVVITFHSAVKPELMAYKKCGSVIWQYGLLSFQGGG